VTLLSKNDIDGMQVPPGHFYGPCSGRDLPIAFRLFGDKIDRFTFCDLSYRSRRASARGAVPDDWDLVSRISGFDKQQPEKKALYRGNRPFKPSAIIEFWRRPDGSDVIVEFREDLAEDVMTDHFVPRSVGAFIHINDSVGEGGSNLWFLGSESQSSHFAQRVNCCLGN
jgi:hypothetical protein